MMKIRAAYKLIGLGTSLMIVVLAWYFSKHPTIMKTKNEIRRKTAKQEKTGGIGYANKTLVHAKGCKNPIEAIQDDGERYGEEKKQKETNENIYFHSESQKLKLTRAEFDQDNAEKLYRIDPVKQGYSRLMELNSGKRTLTTLSVTPPIFAMEDFLSEDECNDIIFMAETQGLVPSSTIGEHDLDALKRSLRQDPSTIFRSLDTNEDGELDLFEVATTITHLENSMITEDDAKIIMMELELDKDKNDVISYSEFLSLSNEEKFKRFEARLSDIAKKNSKHRNRISSTAFLDPREHQEFIPLFDSIRQRIRTITNLSTDIIWSSENLQVVQYGVNGHYNCHYDSLDENYFPDIPCCHYLHHLQDRNCLPCRYLTFFYYLNEPEEGGETAFILAGNTTANPKIATSEKQRHCNLSRHCQEAALIFKPKKGMALMWYNHVIDENTKWLGSQDPLTSHGGCDVIKGTKWAANNWINVGRDLEKDKIVWKKFWEEENYLRESLSDNC